MIADPALQWATSPAEPPLLRPHSLTEFMEMRRRHPDAVVMGGGTLVVPEQQRRRRPPPVLYVAGLGELHATGVDLHGAGTTLADLADDPSVPCAVRSAAASVGGPALRTTATLGGNIAAAQPGCVAVALLALDSTAEGWTNDGRPVSVPLAEVVGRGDRLITTVRWDGSRRSRFAKVRAGSMGPVLCAAAVSTDRSGRDPRVAIGGEHVAPHRVTAAESLLTAGHGDTALLSDVIRRESEGMIAGARALINARLIERAAADLIVIR